MADFLSNFSPTRSDLEQTSNELIMGQKKNQEVLEALLASLDVHSVQKKEKRIAWKTAFTKAKDAFWTDFELSSSSAFGLSMDEERKDAFKHAFSKLHDEVGRDREEWTNRADDIPGFLNDLGVTYLTSMYQRAQDALEDSAIVRTVQSGQDIAFRRLYAQYRDYFIGFASKKFPAIDLDAVADVYQDAWIVIIKYINDQKIRVTQDEKGIEWLIGLRNKASIKTLLTAVGANMLKSGNDGDLNISPSDPVPDLPDPNEALDRFNEDDHALLYQAVETLSKKCQFLLVCRYWLKSPYAEIKNWTEASSEEALRTQTNRCMGYLTNAFEKLRRTK